MAARPALDPRGRRGQARGGLGGAKRLTSHADFPVVNASAGGGRIAYEQAGYVHLLDPATGVSTRLKLGVAADLVELRARWAKGAKWIRGGSLSPSGARVALEFRGEIVTLPREKGDDRNLTQSPGVHERSPAWSPDGEWIAWFSDEGGEYGLVLSPQDGKGASRRIAIGKRIDVGSFDICARTFFPDGASGACCTSHSP